MIEELEARALFAAAIGGVGSVDTTFNGSGRGVISFAKRSIATLYNTVVQPDGKILLVGTTTSIDPQHPGTDIAVARLNPDTTVDLTFGFDPETNESGGGLAAFPFDGNFDAAYGAAVQPDGKILVAGSIASVGATDGTADYTRAMLLRLTPSGRPDPTIKDDNTRSQGIIFPVLSSVSDPTLDVSEGRAVAVQADGKILFAGGGDVVVNGNVSSFSVTRLNSDGSVDHSFGYSGTGVFIDSSDGFFEKAFQVVVGPDQSIYVTGTIFKTDISDGVLGSFLVEKLTTGGRLNESFGSGGAGIAIFPQLFPGDPNEGVEPVSTTLALQPDGKVVLGGTVFHIDTRAEAGGLGTAAFGIARFTAGGQLDNSFGKKGLVEAYYGNPLLPTALPIANQVTVLPNKTILLVGRASLPAGDLHDYSTIAVARFTSKGTLDKSFNKTGKLLITQAGVLTTNAAPGDTDTVANAFSQAAATAAVVPGGGILLLASGADASVQVTRLIADGPDLVASFSAVPVNAAEGSAVTVGISLGNQGSLPLNTKVPVTLRLSADRVYDETDALVGSMMIKVGLGAGVQKVMGVTLTLPAGVTDGSYYLVGSANETRLAGESNYLNNTAAAANVTVVAAPFVNLTAELVSGPAGLKAGKGGTFFVKLTNSGNSAAIGSVVVQLLASLDELESDEDLALIARPSAAVKIAAGANVVLKLAGKVPGGAAAAAYKLILQLNAAAVPLVQQASQSAVVGTFTVS